MVCVCCPCFNRRQLIYPDSYFACYIMLVFETRENLLNTLFTWHKIQPLRGAKIHTSTNVAHEHGLSLILRSWKGILEYRDIGKTIKCISIFLSKFKGIWDTEDVLQVNLGILRCQFWRYLFKSREFFSETLIEGYGILGHPFQGLSI